MNEFYYSPGDSESEKAWSWLRNRSQIQVVPYRLEGDGVGKILEEKGIPDVPCLIIEGVKHVGLEKIMAAAPARKLKIEEGRFEQFAFPKKKD